MVRQAAEINDLLEAALQLQRFCDAQGWQSCFIGGIAVQRWSEPRVTRDVDLTLLTGFGDESRFIDALVGAYPARISDAALFARANRVLLLATKEGVGIDISLAALPFEESVVSRATPYVFEPGVSLRTCSAEDLLVMKLFASRPIDLRDAEGIAIRHHTDLDWRYVEEQLAPLAELKGDAQIMQTLTELRERAST